MNSLEPIMNHIQLARTYLNRISLLAKEVVIHAHVKYWTNARANRSMIERNNQAMCILLCTAIIIVLVHQEVVYLTGPSGIHLSKSKGGWQCSWSLTGTGGMYRIDLLFNF